MKNILVYGFYNKSNIGDDLFAEAFKNLFPQYNFIFINNFNDVELLTRADAVFFGGGSFVYSKINIDANLMPLLNSKKIFYIGIGVENNIHPDHLSLMKNAKLIATRSSFNFVKDINSNAIFVPDIVYSLQKLVNKSVKIDKSVLIMPNIYVVPKWNDAQWKHSSWNYFKSEFSQFLDVLISDGFKINFLAMSSNDTIHDHFASYEIMNMMSNRNIRYQLDDDYQSFADITKLISSYSLVITQRFHGVVLSEMCRVPYLGVHHHDKLKNSIPHECDSISYYGINKQSLLDKFYNQLNYKYNLEIPVDFSIYQRLIDTVDLLLNN